MGTEVSQVTLLSQQQPWHPAWSRQWIPQSIKQNDANPQKPQTIGNVLAPQDENRMRFTFTQLAGGAKVTFLNPSLALSIKVERDSPSPRINDCKNKMTGWHNESDKMEATATDTTIHSGGSCFSEVRRKTNVIRCSQDKTGGRTPSMAHSPLKKWKRGGGVAGS